MSGVRAAAPPSTPAPAALAAPGSDARRLQRWVLGGVVLFSVAWILPLAIRMGRFSGRVNGQNDFLFHVDLTHQVALLPPHVPAPHFLFHILAKAVGAPVGSDLFGGTIVVIAAFACTAAAAFVVCVRPPERELVPLSVRAAGVVAVVFLVADSPAVLVRGTNVLSAGRAYIPLHQMWNPTALVLTPFIVLGLPVMVRYLRDLAQPGDRSPRQVALPAALTAGSLIAKPLLFGVAFIPLVAVYVVARRNADRTAPRMVPRGELFAWAGVGAVLAWQGWFLLVGAPADMRQGLGIAPFETMRGWGADRPDFWLLLLAPVLLVVAAPRAVRRDTTLLVAWGSLAVGFLFFATVVETGDRRGDANAGQALQTGALAVWFFSVRTLAGVVEGGDRRPRALIAIGAVALCVLAGLAGQAQNLGVAPW